MFGLNVNHEYETFGRNLKQILSCLKNISNIVVKENKLLSEGKPDLAGTISLKKKELIDELGHLQRGILIKVTDQLKFKYSNIIKKIIGSYNLMNELIQQNTILLNANLEVARRITEICKNQNVEKTISNYGYNKKGVNDSVGRLEKIMPAINIYDKI